MFAPPSLDFETASPPPDKAIARVFPSGSNTGVLPQTEIIAKSPLTKRLLMKYSHTSYKHIQLQQLRFYQQMYDAYMSNPASRLTKGVSFYNNTSKGKFFRPLHWLNDF